MRMTLGLCRHDMRVNLEEGDICSVGRLAGRSACLVAFVRRCADPVRPRYCKRSCPRGVARASVRALLVFVPGGARAVMQAHPLRSSRLTEHTVFCASIPGALDRWLS